MSKILTVDILIHELKKYGTRVAIEDGVKKLTYSELVTKVASRATYLLQKGLTSADRVGIALRDDRDMLLMQLAAVYAGIPVVSINWRLSPASQVHLAELFGIKTILTIRPTTRNCDLLYDKFCIKESDKCEPAVPFSLTPIGEHLGGDHICMGLLSSGSTGHPKASFSSHKVVAERVQSAIKSPYLLKHAAGKRHLSLLPLAFSAGNFFALYNLSVGNTVVLFSPIFDSNEVTPVLSEKRIDSVFLLPSHLLDMFSLDEEKRRIPSSTSLVITGSAPLNQEQRISILDEITPNLCELYATSAIGNITYSTAEHIRKKPASCGVIAYEASNFEVVADDATACDIGEIGHLRYNGKRLPSFIEGCATKIGSEGYWDGWYYSGDLVSLDIDGALYLHGRKDHMIIRGGVNIHPQLIEQTLSQAPGVVSLAIVAKSHKVLGHVPVAFVVKDQDFEESVFLSFCRDKLSSHEVPDEIRFIDQLPLNSWGKIIRADLPIANN